MKSWFH